MHNIHKLLVLVDKLILDIFFVNSRLQLIQNNDREFKDTYNIFVISICL